MLKRTYEVKIHNGGYEAEIYYNGEEVARARRNEYVDPLDMRPWRYACYYGYGIWAADTIEEVLEGIDDTLTVFGIE